MFGLEGIIWIVPVPDVHDGKILRWFGIGPLHDPGDGSCGRDLSHESPCFLMSDVKKIGEWVIGADGLDKVVLQALSNKDRVGHGLAPETSVGYFGRVQFGRY